MVEIVLATRSAGKIRELVGMVRAAGFEPRTLEELRVGEDPGEDAVERYDTFEENALAKARYFSARGGGRLVLADDSGLSVDALGGAPGVRSRRWAADGTLSGPALDAANNARLVQELARAGDRSARYVCAVAIVRPGLAVVARGECEGTVGLVPRGAGGFGYDPYFVSRELGVTFGEAAIEAKESVSHRGRAVRRALRMLGRNLPRGR